MNYIIFCLGILVAAMAGTVIGRFLMTIAVLEGWITP